MDKYVLVLWPDSQELMDKDWFDECVLHIDLPSAYFVPEERYKMAGKNNKNS